METEIEQIAAKQITHVDQLHNISESHATKVAHLGNLLAHFLYNCPNQAVFTPFKEWFLANASFEGNGIPMPNGIVQLAKYVAAFYLLASDWSPAAFGEEDIPALLAKLAPLPSLAGKPHKMSKEEKLKCSVIVAAIPFPVEGPLAAQKPAQQVAITDVSAPSITEARMASLEAKLSKILTYVQSEDDDYVSSSSSEEGPDSKVTGGPHQNLYCAACGSKCQPDGVFCTHCGKRSTAAPKGSGGKTHVDSLSCQQAMGMLPSAGSSSSSSVPNLCAKHLLQFPASWPQLVRLDDNGASMSMLWRKLEDESFTKSTSNNHHSEVIIELIMLIIANDISGALTLCSDRLQFLKKLGKGLPLRQCDIFYNEMRGEHQSEKTKNAELKAHWLTRDKKADAHVYDELSKQVKDDSHHGTDAAPDDTTRKIGDHGDHRGGRHRTRRRGGRF